MLRAATSRNGAPSWESTKSAGYFNQVSLRVTRSLEAPKHRSARDSTHGWFPTLTGPCRILMAYSGTVVLRERRCGFSISRLVQLENLLSRDTAVPASPRWPLYCNASLHRVVRFDPRHADRIRRAGIS